MIHVYYGMGKGKTTCAIGAGMRAFGAGRRILLIQFLKDNKSSELKALPFDIFNAPDALPFHPDKSYQPWIDSAIDCIKNTDADFIILDEFLDIIGDFITEQDALLLLDRLEGEVIITGHKEMDAVLSKADYVTHFAKIKHPYDSGVKARPGIEY
ncbi:MAG: cob(I)yrinic acid a,c-diamide adenosyltransferase [Clostridium sp.]|nr:cob(I)yrinic acid a,c-diamide adenosyltransferase [Clostridium sp.]